MRVMVMNEKISICYVSYKDEPDSMLKNYVSVLADNDMKIIIITRGRAGQKRNQKFGKNISLKRIFFTKNPTARKSLLAYIMRVCCFLNKNDFDVVMIHSGCKYFVLIKLMAKINTKFIYHLTSHPVSEKNNSVRFYMHKLIVFLQCLFMDSIVILCDELKQHWVGLRNLKKAVIVPIGANMKKVIPIGKQKKNVFQKSLNVPDGVSLLVYCGVISPLRRLDLMVRAFGLVSEKRKSIRLLIIGDGPSLEEIKDLAMKLKLEDKVIFTGQVTHQETLDLVAASDIGLSYIPITESYTYNPPLKTFEYLAAGLPTVATRTVSNSKIIRDEYNGILAEDQPHQFAEAILRLLCDDGLQEKLKTNSRMSIMEYDYSTIVQNKMIPLIEDVIA